MSLLVGIDVGGTFTDAVAFDQECGRIVTAKVRTTPADHAEGFMAALHDVVAAADSTIDGIERIVHGTTVGTNAILERRGARLGILTTAGFEDTLAIGRQKRTEMYDLFMELETPTFLAPRHRIVGIAERVAPTGAVVIPLDEAGVATAIDSLVELDVEAVAICYLFAYANPEHEVRSLAIVRKRYPALPVSLSHRIDPRFREYERLCVTAFDAYVRPVIERYLQRLQTRLHAAGVRPPLQLMHSRGGVTGVDVFQDRPVGSVLSGLAAGVLGGLAAGKGAGAHDGLTLDVGGTSADAALYRDGAPLIASEGRIGRYPLRLPMVDVETIGAGGGSIATVEGGSLRVGPRSAGAEPGPACYGMGGSDPTVTDASLLLGYLNPSGLAGGKLPLSVDLAERAIAQRIAAPLGMSTIQAAAGIHRILNAMLADALRLISIRRGEDPRRFTLVALGGAGPIHAGRLAVELSIPRVVIPVAPGVLSALGLLMADVDHQEWGTLRSRATDIDPRVLDAALRRLADVCAARMARDGVAPDAVGIRRIAELRYAGQSYELQTPIPDGEVTKATIETCCTRFHELHQQHYGQSDPAGAVEFVSLRVQYTHSSLRPSTVRGVQGDGAPHGERPAYFAETGGWVATPVWQRTALRLGQRLSSPAIVEQADSTTVVYPGQTAWPDDAGNLILEMRSGT